MSAIADTQAPTGVDQGQATADVRALLAAGTARPVQASAQGASFMDAMGELFNACTLMRAASARTAELGDFGDDGDMVSEISDDVRRLCTMAARSVDAVTCSLFEHAHLFAGVELSGVAGNVAGRAA